MKLTLQIVSDFSLTSELLYYRLHIYTRTAYVRTIMYKTQAR